MFEIRSAHGNTSGPVNSFMLRKLSRNDMYTHVHTKEYISRAVLVNNGDARKSNFLLVNPQSLSLSAGAITGRLFCSWA